MKHRRQPSAAQLPLFCAPVTAPLPVVAPAPRRRTPALAPAPRAVLTAEQEDADLLADLLFQDPHCNLDPWCE